MGLDGIELILAVEEEFGIEIGDAEAESLTTPGRLIELVLAKVPRMPTSARCGCQRTFHRMRRRFRSVLGTPRASFRPDTDVEGLLPSDGRRDRWQLLGAALPDPGQWPRLVRPARVVSGICVATIGAGASAVFTGGLLGGWPGVAWGATLSLAVVMPIVAAVGVRLTRHCRTAVPGTCRTVRSMVHSLAPRTPGRGRRWTDRAIADAVRAIVREQLGVRDFRDDDDFVRDLGIG